MMKYWPVIEIENQHIVGGGALVDENPDEGPAVLEDFFGNTNNCQEDEELHTEFFNS